MADDQLFTGIIDRAHIRVALEVDRTWSVRMHYRAEFDPPQALRDFECSGLSFGELLQVIESTLLQAPVSE